MEELEDDEISSMSNPSDSSEEYIIDVHDDDEEEQSSLDSPPSDVNRKSENVAALVRYISWVEHICVF